MPNIIELVRQEELRFLKQLNKGMKLLDKLLLGEQTEIAGDVVFDLYSTYGFPVELTKEIVQERGKTIDLDGFNQSKEQHRKQSGSEKFKVDLTEKK